MTEKQEATYIGPPSFSVCLDMVIKFWIDRLIRRKSGKDQIMTVNIKIENISQRRKSLKTAREHGRSSLKKMAMMHYAFYCECFYFKRKSSSLIVRQTFFPASSNG